MAAGTKTPSTNLTGAQKAALIISSIGLDAAAVIFKALPEDEMEAVTEAIGEIQDVPHELRMQALQEFTAQLKGDSGSEAFELRALLEKSVGREKAAYFISKARTGTGGGKYFEFLNTIDPQQIYCALRQERPQILALIFCHLDPKRAAEILASFDPEFQTQVLVRIGRMNRVSPEMIEKIEHVLRKKLSAVQVKLREAGGPKIIAQVMNHIDRGIEKQIIDTLQTKDASLLDDVKRLMLVFDDLATLPQKGAQALLREVDMNDIGLALKGASAGMKDLIFKNLSARAAERLKEEMELMGPKPKSEVEEAQQRIIAVVRRLEEEGKIQLARAGKEDELVA